MYYLDQKVNLKVDLDKIVNIFADKLFAFHYDEAEDNEYDRLMNLWDDTEYIYDFLKKNEADIPGGKSIQRMAEDIVENAYEIDETLIRITENNVESLSHFFKPLHNQEYQMKILSLQKGRQYYLRIYAIKISENVFVITGGAIKLHHLMQDRDHTKEELRKLRSAREYLLANDMFDDESFFEFLEEN